MLLALEFLHLIQELLPVFCYLKKYPSARFVSAANLLCKYVDIFRKFITLLKQILR